MRYYNAAEVFINENATVQCAMRALGVDEAHVCGSASDFERWRALCEVFCDLEGGAVADGILRALSERFGVSEAPSPKTCVYIWNKVAEHLCLGHGERVLIEAREGTSLGVLPPERLPLELDKALALDADAISGFVPPNPYEAELARRDALTDSPSRASLDVIARISLRDDCLAACREGRALLVACGENERSDPLDFVPFFKMLTRLGAHPSVCFCVGKDPERMLVAAEKVAFLYGNVGNDRKRRIFLSRIPQNAC